MNQNPQIKLNLAVWTTQKDQHLVTEIQNQLADQIQICAIGNPSASSLPQLAQSLNLKATDDLRTLILDSHAQILFLTHTQGLTLQHLQLAAQQNLIIATTQPLAQQINDLPPAQLPVIFLPTFLESQGWQSALSPMQALDKPKLIHISHLSTSNQSSLFANLYDAWQILAQIAPPPQAICASLTGPLSHTPENLYAITGHIALHANLPNSQTFTINASDAAGSPLRSLRVIANNADLLVDQNNYQIYDKTNQIIEASEHPNTTHTYTQLLIQAIRHATARILNHQKSQNQTTPTQTIANINTSQQSTILACCQATLLSARTNQPESPEMFLQMFH